MNRREFVVAAAGLAVAPDALARSLGGGSPVALVTADLESRIIALDALRGHRLRTIEVPAGPRSVQGVGATAVIAHTASGTVSIVDGPTLELRPSALHLDQPRYTAASRDGALRVCHGLGLAGARRGRRHPWAGRPPARRRRSRPPCLHLRRRAAPVGRARHEGRADRRRRCAGPSRPAAPRPPQAAVPRS